MDRKHQRGPDIASGPRLSFPRPLAGASSWLLVSPRDHAVRGTAWPPAIHVPSTDVSQTIIYTHVLNRGWAAVRSPADRVLMPPTVAALAPIGPRAIDCRAPQAIPEVVVPANRPETLRGQEDGGLPRPVRGA